MNLGKCHVFGYLNLASKMLQLHYYLAPDSSKTARQYCQFGIYMYYSITDIYRRQYYLPDSIIVKF
jgi:hypothetical protein